MSQTEHYFDNTVSRRRFIKHLSILSAGICITQISGCGKALGVPQFESIPSDDLRIEARTVKYRGVNEMTAYLVRPKQLRKYPSILLIHDSQGLDSHIKEVARRLALAGFIVLAPDALAPMGGTPPDLKEASAMMKRLGKDKDTLVDEHNKIDVDKNFESAIGKIRGYDFSNGRVGLVGIGWGGTLAIRLAVRSSDVPATVSFYGQMNQFRGGGNLQTAFLFHVPEDDKRIINQLFDFENKLIKADVQYTIHRYPDTKSGFFTEVRPRLYQEDQAIVAWERTLDFLNDKLIDKRNDFP